MKRWQTEASYTVTVQAASEAFSSFDRKPVKPKATAPWGSASLEKAWHTFPPLFFIFSFSHLFSVFVGLSPLLLLLLPLPLFCLLLLHTLPILLLYLLYPLSLYDSPSASLEIKIKMCVGVRDTQRGRALPTAAIPPLYNQATDFHSFIHRRLFMFTLHGKMFIASLLSPYTTAHILFLSEELDLVAVPFKI